MKPSSRRQLEFDYTGTSEVGRNTGDTLPERDAARNQKMSTAPTQTPSELPVHNDVYAATSRAAGRINAASVSEGEYQELLEERQKLLDKKFDGSLSRQEGHRLEYVRWSLDRIEDAKYGWVLDELDAAVQRYENFLQQVRDLDKQIRRYIMQRK